MGLNWGFGDGKAGPYMGRCMAWCLVMWFWGLINAVLFYFGLGGGKDEDWCWLDLFVGGVLVWFWW